MEITEFYEKKSLIVTSNLEFNQWNRIFINSRLTAALVDRLIHHAHIVTYSGENFRINECVITYQLRQNLWWQNCVQKIAIHCTFSLKSTIII
ncbi:ATP-binding protein [Sporosarcina limicola]|uniref:ATP-binding protein n=1 Tax=Sporosarcina limicola TaxID=34101 RepID=UPI001789B60B